MSETDTVAAAPTSVGRSATACRLRFLLASAGSPLLAELVALIATVATDLGVASDVMVDAYPEPNPEDVYVLVSHELFELAPGRGGPAPAQLRRTIALCTEPPDSPSFALAAHYARQAAVALHTHRSGCEQLARHGISAERFQLGYSSRWDCWRGEEDPSRPRAIDVLHIGARDAYRAAAIGGWAQTLWRHHCRFVLPPTLDAPSAQLAGLLPEGMPQALRGARILVNLHRHNHESFEWPLALAAIANGCVVVSEHTIDTEPLEAGVHYLSGGGADLARLADRLLHDEQRLRELQSNAYDLVRRELPLARSVGRLIELATGLLGRPCGEPAPLAPPPAAAVQGADPALTAQLSAIAGSLGRLHHETLELRRRLERIEHRMGSSEPLEEPLEVYRSDTLRDARPRVSVIVSLYEYEHEVRECLESVAASQLRELEVLVLDDASRDGSLAAAREALAAHPELPALLLAHRVNLGVGRVRNALIERARGELVFVLDADNLIFPTALGRLAAALERDPAASFAYPILVAHRNHRPVDVFNAWPWDPRRLVASNYIDALALIHRTALVELGGYSEQIHIGSEDHDLWCQMAERGRHGVLVPEILAVYRIQDHSKLRTFASQSPHALSRIRARAPGLMRRLAEEDEALGAGE